MRLVVRGGVYEVDLVRVFAVFPSFLYKLDHWICFVSQPVESSFSRKWPGTMQGLNLVGGFF